MRDEREVMWPPDGTSGMAATKRIAARLLELAVAPNEPRDDIAELLEIVEPSLNGAMHTDWGRVEGLACRVAAAGGAIAVLNRSPSERFDATVQRHARQNAVAVALANRCPGEHGAERTLRLLQASFLPAEANRPRVDTADATLVADMREFASAPLDPLLDAHPLVRLAAVSLGLADAAEGARARAAALLALDADDCAALEAAGREAVGRLFGADNTLSREALLTRARCLLDTALAGYAAAATGGPTAALGAVEREAHKALGRPIAVFSHDETHLVLAGGGDLQGLSVRLEAQASGAARAVLEQRLARFEAAAGPVVDRQLARRLEATELLAIPIRSDPPRGALVVGADAQDEMDTFVPRALATVAGNWMDERPRSQPREEEDAEPGAGAWHAAYEQRLREIVHEAHNPLGVVRNYLHILGVRLEDRADVREPLRIIREEIARAGEIIAQVREVPREAMSGSTASDTPQPAEINGVVREVLQLLEPAVFGPAGIHVDVDLDTQVPTVTVAARQLKQMLTNLLQNAAEATQAGESVQVTTARSIESHGRLQVAVTVADSGSGVAPERLHALFEPGTSGKTGHNRGLGLSIVRDLVAASAGHLWCYSRPGAGTTFHLLLPAATE